MRHKIFYTRGYRYNLNELMDCNIQMWSYTKDNKLILWLQRHNEPPRYAMCELISTYLAMQHDPGEIFNRWNKVEREYNIDTNTKPIQVVGNIISGAPIDAKISNFGTRGYAAWILNLNENIKFSYKFLVLLLAPSIDGAALLSITNGIVIDFIHILKNRWGKSMSWSIYGIENNVLCSW